MGIGGISLKVPVVSWVIGAVYFIGDPIVTRITRKGIAEYFGDAVDTSVETYKEVTNWLSCVESALGHWGYR